MQGRAGAGWCWATGDADSSDSPIFSSAVERIAAILHSSVHITILSTSGDLSCENAVAAAARHQAAPPPPAAGHWRVNDWPGGACGV